MVGWDLVSLYKQMSGNDRVFIVYLVLIFVFCLVRSLRLGGKLWLFSPAGRVDQREPDASDLLAAIALANKLPNNGKTTEEPWRVVESAKPRFEYLWQQRVTKVAAIKDFGVLTLILSGLVLSCDFMRFLTEVQSGRYPAPSGADVSGGPAELLVPLFLGFAVAAVLFTLSSFYAGALARRKAAWNLFEANAGRQRGAE